MKLERNMDGNTEFYSLSVNSPAGEMMRMADFKGETILIVNTATKCGLVSQLMGLEKLHQKYRERGLVVMGFPCNQFGNQEPLSNEDMVEGCKKEFGVTFLLTEKIEVNGDNTHPVFIYLKEELKGIFGKKIKWNYTKFLITSEGRPYKRFAPTTKPEKLEKDILGLLGH